MRVGGGLRFQFIEERVGYKELGDGGPASCFFYSAFVQSFFCV